MATSVAAAVLVLDPHFPPAMAQGVAVTAAAVMVKGRERQKPAEPVLRTREAVVVVHQRPHTRRILIGQEEMEDRA
jgi:hypothetical protein